MWIHKRELNKYIKSKGYINTYKGSHSSWTGNKTLNGWGYKLCFNFHAQLNETALKRVKRIRHLTGGPCSLGVECLCIRYNETDSVQVVKHRVGECPLCNYKRKK